MARSSLRGLVRQATDFLDYVHHRSRLLLRSRALRREHRRAFRGRVNSILIVRLASIGDVVRATAVIQALRTRYPDAAIDVLTTDATRGVIAHHPALRAVYTLADLDRLGQYDWVINLQTIDPPASFLRASGLTYRQILEHLSTRLGARIVSGRHVENGREVTSANILYCVAEMEELFRIALLPYDPMRYPATAIHLDDATHGAVVAKFGLPSGKPLLALFLGSNSVGCGADEGFRTYSIGYLERLIDHFAPRFTVVMIGQSQMKTAAEQARYRALLAQRPDVIDLVDRTSLDELVALMDRFAVVVSCDSSPVHIARARGVPVVGLYVSDASYRLGPKLEYEGLIGLNSEPPCFKYSWRWKFFCLTCRDRRTRAAYCVNEAFTYGVDRISVSRIDNALRSLGVPKT
jgi:ADP-heptose:LPS heptosyltransferase